MPQSSPEEHPGGYDAAGFWSLFLEQAAIMPLSNVQVQSLSPLALAYLGDAVYELLVRSYHLVPAKRIRAYHQQVVHHVRAEQQAHYSKLLQPHLTAAEVDIMRRGRNATPNRKQRANAYAYQQATSLETLVGYLYLTDPQRLLEILRHLPLDEAKPE